MIKDLRPAYLLNLTDNRTSMRCITGAISIYSISCGHARHKKSNFAVFIQMPDKVVESCQYVWYEISTKLISLPDRPSEFKQLSWDKPVAEREFSILLQHQVDDYSKARLLVATSKRSVYWFHMPTLLHYVSNASMITQLGSRSAYTSEHSHLSTSHVLLQRSSRCQRNACPLSCKRSGGRFIWHNHLNYIIHRS